MEHTGEDWTTTGTPLPSFSLRFDSSIQTYFDLPFELQDLITDKNKRMDFIAGSLSIAKSHRNVAPPQVDSTPKSEWKEHLVFPVNCIRLNTAIFVSGKFNYKTTLNLEIKFSRKIERKNVYKIILLNLIREEKPSWRKYRNGI